MKTKKMECTKHGMYGDPSQCWFCLKCGFCRTCGDCDKYGCGSENKPKTK